MFAATGAGEASTRALLSQRVAALGAARAATATPRPSAHWPCCAPSVAPARTRSKRGHPQRATAAIAIAKAAAAM